MFGYDCIFILMAINSSTVKEEGTKLGGEEDSYDGDFL